MKTHEDLIRLLKEKFGDIDVSVDKFGDVWVNTSVDVFKDILSFLKDLGYSHLTTISAVDYIDENEFELIYHVVAFDDSEYRIPVNVRYRISRDNPVAPTILDVYPNALVYEREVFDLMGIVFEGHKGLKRILLPDDTPEDFHPLRKDFKIKVGGEEK